MITEPVLQDTLKTVSGLSTGAIKTIRDAQGLISDTEALMKSTGATLDDGTKQTLEGLAARPAEHRQRPWAPPDENQGRQVQHLRHHRGHLG
ncbi:MAG: hypothetical protein ACLU38_07900 [Dysosmobacter sp.]